MPTLRQRAFDRTVYKYQLHKLFVVRQVEPETRTMIVSERAAIMEEAIHRVQPGDTVTVVVRNLVPYGAFVTIKDPASGDLTGGHVSCAALLPFKGLHYAQLPIMVQS